MVKFKEEAKLLDVKMAEIGGKDYLSCWLLF